MKGPIHAAARVVVLLPILTHLSAKGSDLRMTLQDAFDLFRRLGVHPEMMSRADFSMAFYRLARRYHPDVTRQRPS